MLTEGVFLLSTFPNLDPYLPLLGGGCRGSGASTSSTVAAPHSSDTDPDGTEDLFQGEGDLDLFHFLP